MTRNVIAAGGVTLACRIDGVDTGAPVLLCNAIGTTTAMWAPQVDRLGRRFRVVRYDARGHGRSSPSGGPVSIEDLGRDALAVLDGVNAPRAHVVGLSMGGLTAMWLGIHAPERVHSLVLANTAARLGTSARWTDRIAMVQDLGMPAVAEMAMSIWFSPAFREGEPKTVEGFRRTIAACSPDAYIACCRALGEADLRSSIGQVHAPTLVIAGSLDHATTVADAEAIRDGIPGAALRTLEAAHLSNVEQPDLFTDTVEAFLGVPSEHAHG